jgi:hypothetical protein
MRMKMVFLIDESAWKLCPDTPQKWIGISFLLWVSRMFIQYRAEERHLRKDERLLHEVGLPIPRRKGREKVGTHSTVALFSG